MAASDVRWLQRLENDGRALATLQRALQTARERALSELEEQGLIQAFEFTHELSWLLLKDFLVDQGVSGISGCAMPCVRRWCGSCCPLAVRPPGWR